MSPERVFTAELVIPRTPWDVYELLADESQQVQWRKPHSVLDAPLETEEPYTRLVYADGLEFELEPEGSGTLLRATRRRYSRGVLGGIGLALFGRGSEESDLDALLRRVEAALLYEM